MVELLVVEDVEWAFIKELNQYMPAHGFEGKAGPQIPNPRPDEFIRVVVTGGTERDLVTDSPTVTVESFASRVTRAERQAAFALGVVQAAGRRGVLGGVTCYGVAAFGRPVNLPMASVTDRIRYTFTVSADLRKLAV